MKTGDGAAAADLMMDDIVEDMNSGDIGDTNTNHVTDMGNTGEQQQTKTLTANKIKQNINPKKIEYKTPGGPGTNHNLGFSQTQVNCS